MRTLRRVGIVAVRLAIIVWWFSLVNLELWMDSDTVTNVDPGTLFSLAGVVHVLIVAGAGYHVLMNKQNEGAAFSWIGIITLSPFFGVILYWLFGINRIQRRAQAELTSPSHDTSTISADMPPRSFLFDLPLRWQGLMRLGTAIHPSDYLWGNHFEPLLNGDEAYPAMLAAIEASEKSVVLSSYIFEYDTIGKRFVEALIAASERGVAVRVLIDGLGVGYGLSLVRSDRVLRRRGVRTARFLSFLSSTGTRFINLRNHRKILSVDGKVAFVGGMNIRDNNVQSSDAKEHTLDVHFKVTGPVINQINAVFVEDWQFASGESLSLPRWQGGAVGEVTSRVLLDGPDNNYQKLLLTIIGVINAARQHIRIATPYFLPGHNVIQALQLAVLRGVRVEIVVPAKNNLPPVGWAMHANERILVEHGIHLYESEAPFDHSKLFTVDDRWSLVGSSNWDARSLELNFEINLESYDIDLNRRIAGIVDVKRQAARRVLPGRTQPLMYRLRNNFFRLFSPYL